MDEEFYDVVLQDHYFKWLCGIIGFRNVDFSTCRHCLLLIYLYNIDFYIVAPSIGLRSRVFSSYDTIRPHFIGRCDTLKGKKEKNMLCYTHRTEQTLPRQVSLGRGVAQGTKEYPRWHRRIPLPKYEKHSFLHRAQVATPCFILMQGGFYLCQNQANIFVYCS